MIKYKIDRIKFPQIYTDQFPELLNLSEAAKINLDKIWTIRDYDSWAVNKLNLTKEAYHYYSHKEPIKYDFALVPIDDGNALTQLCILETGTKHIHESKFLEETTKMMNYLQFLLHKIGNIDVQKDFGQFQRLIHPRNNPVDWKNCTLMKLFNENK